MEYLKYYSASITPEEVAEGLKSEDPVEVLAAKKAFAKQQGVINSHGLLITNNVFSDGTDHFNQIFVHVPSGFTQDPQLLEYTIQYVEKFKHFNHWFNNNTLGFILIKNGVTRFTSFPLYNPDGAKEIYDIFGMPVLPDPDLPLYGSLVVGVTAYLGIHPKDFENYIITAVNDYLRNNTVFEISTYQKHLGDLIISDTHLNPELWTELTELNLREEVYSNETLFKILSESKDYSKMKIFNLFKAKLNSLTLDSVYWYMLTPLAKDFRKVTVTVSTGK